MKNRYTYLLMAGLTLATGTLSAAAMQTAVYASQTETELTDESESETETETELQPVLLDTDKVSTDEILLYGSACVVMDVDNGAILYYKNRSDRHYPASTTKILTTYLALENSNLTDEITFSADAVGSIDWQSSNMEIEVGDKLTMEQALYGVMLQSANEAAYGVAEYISGSSEAFAEYMTDYARSIGCYMTHFTNASGLHDDNHYTTAKDLAKITATAIKNEEFKKIAGTITYSVENVDYKWKMPEKDDDDDSRDNDDTDESKKDEPVPDPFLLYNHHKMVNNEYPFKGCYAGKTGYTEEARNTLVTYAERDGVNLVCVLLDCPGGKNYIYQDTELALTYCFENYSRLKAQSDATMSYMDYPDMGLRDWYHISETPLSAEEGYYPFLKQSASIYFQYLQDQKSQETLDKAISNKSVRTFIEYSQMNHYRPLIIVMAILFVFIIVVSLALLQLTRVLRRRRSRKRYEKLRQKRLEENKNHQNTIE